MPTAANQIANSVTPINSTQIGAGGASINPPLMLAVASTLRAPGCAAQGAPAMVLQP